MALFVIVYRRDLVFFNEYAMNQEKKNKAVKYLGKRKASLPIRTEIVWPPTKRHIEDLQQQAKRCKTELISVETKIVQCQEERSINRKMERLNTEAGCRYVYIVNGSKAQIVHRIFQTSLNQEFEHTLPSDVVSHTFLMRREAGCDEWREWSSDQVNKTDLIKICSLVRDVAYWDASGKVFFQGLTMNDYPIEDKNESWELKFDLDKKDAFEQYTADAETYSVRRYLSSQVVLFGHESTIAKLREYVSKRSEESDAEQDMEKDMEEAKDTEAYTKEAKDKELATKEANVDKMDNKEQEEEYDEFSETDEEIAKIRKLLVESEERAKKQDAGNDDEEEEEEEEAKGDDGKKKKTDPKDAWKQWRADPTDDSCLDSLDDEFNKTWLKKNKSKKYHSLNIEYVLSAIKRYHPTVSKPFVVDTAMLEGNGTTRIGFLISNYFEDYEKNGPALLHKHGLAASCYVRGSPMFARSVFHIYESEREGLPVDAYNRIHTEYNKYDCGF